MIFYKYNNFITAEQFFSLFRIYEHLNMCHMGFWFQNIAIICVVYTCEVYK
jgi:hypothetical protein